MSGSATPIAKPKIIAAGAIWASFTVFIVMLLGSHELLPEAPDKFIYDLRTALLSDRAEAQRTDIAVVLITENTLSRYWSRSPVDRALLAEVVRAIDAAKPKAIGLDFVFDRPADPAKDAALLAAIRGARTPIILGATDERESGTTKASLARQQEFLTKAGKPFGHVFFAARRERLTLGDNVVRLADLSTGSAPAVSSLDELLANSDGPRTMPSRPYIAWLLPPKNGPASVFPVWRVPEKDPVDGTSTGSGLIPASWAEILRGRIVLVGGDFIDRDQHLTPLSVLDGVLMPGVMIHAQVVAQLRDGRSIRELPQWVEILALVLIAALAFWVGHRYRLKGEDLIIHLAGVVILLLVGPLLFWAAKITIPSAALFFAWLIGVTGGHFCDTALRKLRLAQ